MDGVWCTYVVYIYMDGVWTCSCICFLDSQYTCFFVARYVRNRPEKSVHQFFFFPQKRLEYLPKISQINISHNLLYILKEIKCLSLPLRIVQHGFDKLQENPYMLTNQIIEFLIYFKHRLISLNYRATKTTLGMIIYSLNVN